MPFYLIDKISNFLFVLFPHIQFEKIKNFVTAIIVVIWIILGIAYNPLFIWFDNDIYTAEWGILEKCTENQVVVEVNLRANPHHLEEITRDILNRL